MAFAFAGASALDYFPCSYGGSRLIFRGPKRALAAPYVAVLGGTETYGKFVASPFPAILEHKTGRHVVNLGCLNAGPDVFLQDATVLDLAAQAGLTILQITGAANLSNRFYDVHPRRNDRFLRASPWLRTLYREVDFTEFHFTRHMLHRLHDVSVDRFDLVVTELRAAWIVRMQALLDRLPGPVLLLWMAGHAPGPQDAPLDLARDPLLVDAAMLAALGPAARNGLQVVYSEAARREGVENLYFSGLERPAAEEVPGTLAHREVAEALIPVVTRILG
ncbi:DUF6473 family protein [Szabonella alba]|uniref:DUF6473 domain-containing protein n=1 Tax=Szabonella alba TaxID=2804194 RepID=A0A8K0VDW4_9RHOB|nr:DUF6473 family protein [Szabonella alba]MBL4918418.1 hypothetical protein [Szabonella alba]